MSEASLNIRARARLGTVLRGKYKLDDVLGTGGMAIVYRATHRNQAEFAVKMLRPELSEDKELRARFLREGYVANSVKHPGAVAVVDDDVAEDGSAFLVMELLSGTNADTLLEKSNNHVPPEVASAICAQMLDVLAAAHAKAILHRDLKPANLFVTFDGAVKLLDFGVARIRDLAATSPQATQTGVTFGTPAFMAPEQARGDTKDIDERTDIWATGATLFTLITGRFVHEGDNAAQISVRAATLPARPLLEIDPSVPPAIAAVVDRALAFDRARRWSSAAEMREALLAAHGASFGHAPSRDALAQFVASVAPSPTSGRMAATRRAGQAAEDSTAAMAGVTGQPVSSDKRARATRSIALVAGGSALAALVLFAIGVTVIAPRFAREPAKVQASSSQQPRVTSVASTALTPLPIDQPPTIAVSALPTISAPHPAVGKPAPHPRASASVAKPNCNPPYTVDANGDHHFKDECYE